MNTYAAISETVQAAYEQHNGQGDCLPYVIRPMRLATTEHDEQVALFDILRLNETRLPELKWIFAVPNGGKRHVATAVKLQREGVKAGVADIGIPIPRNGFHGAFIEMKVKPNKPTPEQIAFLAAMQEAGYAVKVAYSADEALRFIEDYLDMRLRK